MSLQLSPGDDYEGGDMVLYLDNETETLARHPGCLHDLPLRHPA